MLTVTEKAGEYLLEALTRREEGMPEAVRIIHGEAGYQLILDNAKEGDHVFEREGQSYLLVGAELSEALEGATIDVQESSQGASLTLLSAGTPASAETEEESQPED